MLGDSLTADIIGGINYGIDTCWYNPNHLSSNLKITYVIDDLLDLIKLIK
ncbi:MAG: haloacid dehalogenase [Coprobacillus sp. 28_7]|nr:MAG: haloacid dehalogenase [Coprobacillus sp. 28_7]